MYTVYTCLSEVLDADVVHWEVAHGGPILWTHVGDGCSVCNGQLGHSRTKELDKLANNTSLTKVLQQQWR